MPDIQSLVRLLSSRDETAIAEAKATYGAPSVEGADLQGVDLSGLDLSGWRLDGVNLSGADLASATLEDAWLRNAQLTEATARSANFAGADFTGAILCRVDLSDTDLSECILRGADLSEAILRRATLDEADFTNVRLLHADLRSCDLRGVRGIRLDGNDIGHARFSPRARDPWSVLRRTYTGSSLLFHGVALMVFFGLYALKVSALVGLNRLQWTLGDALSLRGEEWRVWELMLGLDQGWVFAVLAMLILAYNGARLVLTRQVSALREEEERTHFAPSWSQYGRLFALHRIVRLLLLVAIGSFVVHAVAWMSETVFVPEH